ncbi:hypothetical protein IMCC14465_10310 [alpha proteobacterium IMCC14465]|uniref:Uncharacterized protein n=1 Tax=alpha proteobacterium IMCC14465 TaxID=1220535 RepID=J9A4F1_9PROT|nr:hypothetical protein IMCC14465_10310 [alpha proteobacterium IMCC14465]
MLSEFEANILFLDFNFHALEKFIFLRSQVYITTNDEC